MHHWILIDWQQSWIKYMRQLLVLMWNIAIRGNYNFYFSSLFCQYQKKLSLDRRLGTRLTFYEVLRFSGSFLMFFGNLRDKSHIRNLLTNNHASLLLWWKENLQSIKKSQNILCPWLSAKFSFAFYVFINSSNC